MSTRHLVDPELLPLLDAWPMVALDESTLPLIRAPGRLPMGAIEHPERVERCALVAPGQGGAPPVPLIAYRPAGHAQVALPCLYHIHGGGYVAGSAAAMEPIHRALVEAIGCALVTVDYRLAPETPYPGPLEDCHAGLDWLFRNAVALGVDAQRIGVGGESAGGGLAAGLALLVRDRGERRLAFQHLIYPMLDDRTCTRADPNPVTGEYVWNAPNNRFGWECYLGTGPGSEGVPAYAAPARATDLSGLPPSFVSTGSLDLFLEEDVDYATRLIRAGVPVELHVYPGGVHAFDLAQTAAIAQRARRDSWDFLRRHLFAGAGNG